MAGRKPKFTEEILLKKASQLFWKKGYFNCSTRDLILELNINKGTLYNTFGSKKELFIRCLAYLEDDWFEQMENKIATTDTPYQELVAIFNSICDESENQRNLGCILGNTLIETVNKEPELQKLTTEYLTRLKNLFKLGISKAIEKKEIKTLSSPQEIALILISLWNGIQVTKRLPYKSEELKWLIDHHLNDIKSKSN